MIISGLFRRFEEEPGVKLWFNDLLPAPYAGRKPPVLTPENLSKLKIRKSFYLKDFDLSNPDHQNEFCDVMNSIVNGRAFKICRIDHKDEKTGKIKVHLEWANIYSDMPNDD